MARCVVLRRTRGPVSFAHTRTHATHAPAPPPLTAPSPRLQLFAVCPIRPGGPAAVEPTNDSSRYFALRLENAAGHVAYVGVGFNNREDAFDLKSALADHTKQLEVEEKGIDVSLDGVAETLGLRPEALGGAGASGGLDLSLKDGQTMSIKIGGKLGGSSAPSSSSSSSTGGGLGGGKLAAPGVAAGKLAAPGTKPAAAAPAPAPAASEWETF